MSSNITLKYYLYNILYSLHIECQSNTMEASLTGIEVVVVFN